MYADKEKDKEYHRQYSKVYNKERYKMLNDNNICVACGCKEAFNGMTRCPQCLENNIINRSNDLEHNNKMQRNRRTRRKEAGICQYCKEPVYEGSKLFCQKHHEEHKAKNRIYAANRRARSNKILLPEEVRYAIQCKNAEKARSSENFKKHTARVKARISIIVNNIKLRKEASQKIFPPA